MTVAETDKAFRQPRSVSLRRSPWPTTNLILSLRVNFYHTRLEANAWLIALAHLFPRIPSIRCTDCSVNFGRGSTVRRLLQISQFNSPGFISPPLITQHLQHHKTKSKKKQVACND
jgi:hypothetical protein